MKYITKVAFNDLQDNEYRYNTGDIYPREGLNPTEERIKELSTENNKRGIVLITAIKSSAPKEAVADEKAEAKAEDKSKKVTKKKPS